MSLQSAVRRLKLANDRASVQYQNDQTRALGADPESSVRVWDPVTRAWLSVQPPMRAVERITSVVASEPPVWSARSDHDPVTPALESPPAQFGAPQSFTLADFRLMDKEQQSRAIRAVLLVDGARERMAPVPGRTLTQALERELDYQRQLIRAATSEHRDGRATRFSKSVAKRDRTKGAKPLKPGGTAAFTRGTPVRVTVLDQTPFPVPGQYRSVETVKLRRIDRTLLKANSE